MIQLRPAGFSDLKLLQRWDKAPHVIAAKGTEDWGWQAELHRQPDWREQLIAEVEGTPIGFLQIIDPARDESHYWGECQDGGCLPDRDESPRSGRCPDWGQFTSG